jgi:hypothetical protein
LQVFEKFNQLPYNKLRTKIRVRLQTSVPTSPAANTIFGENLRENFCPHIFTKEIRELSKTLTKIIDIVCKIDSIAQCQFWFCQKAGF